MVDSRKEESSKRKVNQRGMRRMRSSGIDKGLRFRISGMN